MPDTNGVNTARKCRRNGERMICNGAVKHESPNIRANPPACHAWVRTPIKAKLVPVTLSKPEPAGPRLRHCRKVPNPEASRARLMR